jgi:hypothetical protein
MHPTKMRPTLRKRMSPSSDRGEMRSECAALHPAQVQLEDGPRTATVDRQLQLQRFANQSPVVRQLNRWQSKANQSPVVIQAQQAADSPSGRMSGAAVVQRTKWRYDGNSWVIESKTKKDKDPHPHPKIAYPYPAKGDTYDQNTGKYVSPLHLSIEKFGQSKGKKIGFYDGRSTTAYKYASGKARQGPHTFAHISKRMLMAICKDMGYEFDSVVGSRLLPPPKRANKMMRDRLRLRGKNWRDETRDLRTAYLKQYKRVYLQAQRSKKRQQLLAIKRGMELNPATVYNIGKGKTSSSEISGKGESRKKSATDLKYLARHKGDLKNDKGLLTMDLSGATKLEKKESLKMVSSMKDFMCKGELDPDSGDESSDSDLDLDV